MPRFFYIPLLSIRYFFAYRLFPNQRPKLLREYFEKAGGAFIKFGQLLALRVDVLPKEYFLELVNLFDQVKPFSYPEVERIIIDELGAPPKTIFSYFEKEPFASASFGQVHAAKIGEEKVIVKIQRPAINHLLTVDFLFLNLMAAIGNIFFKIEALPWRELATEFKTWTKREIDYQLEAEQAQTIYDNLKNAGIDNVIIPKTYHHLTTKKVLVQEYIKGVSISRILRELKNKTLTYEQLKRMGLDIHQAPITLITEIMREYFFDGYFHADPHPGNILLLKDGKIALLDFGIVGKAAPKRREFLRFVKAGAEGHYDQAGYYFLKFAGSELEQIVGSMLPASVNPKHIDDIFQLLAQHFSQAAKSVEQQVKKDLDDMKIDYSMMSLQMLKITDRYHIKLPSEMAVFIRALSVFGFMAKELDEKFYLTNVVLNFTKKYSEDDIPTRETGTATYKRLNREVAIEKFNNWLAYLTEKDPKLYQLVDSQIARYNQDNN
jgi:ubiquinone biosynthesis protein